VDADHLVSISHFKGHDLAGFGGALKNIGMGCATRQGKMQQHCGMGPLLKPENCRGCGLCVEVCRPGALTLNEKTISLDAEKCVGCAACLLACRHGGLDVNWKVEINTFLERMMEYAAGVLTLPGKKFLHLNFLVDITPGCDCVGFSDAPLCADLGVLASTDPVALDQAALDLVNRAVPRDPSGKGFEPGKDKFHALHSHVQGEYALEYAQKIGLGSRSYRLFSI
ncbi:MAG: DUF362 domain-containing protein, partial [Desulfovibrionales bacterium]